MPIRYHLHVRTIDTHLFHEKSLDTKTDSDCFFLLELQVEVKAKILMRLYLIIKRIKILKRKAKMEIMNSIVWCNDCDGMINRVE